MNRPDLKPLAAAERRDLADFLETLAPPQWQGPTLCPEWTVHQLVAHRASPSPSGATTRAIALTRHVVENTTVQPEKLQAAVRETLGRETVERLAAALQQHGASDVAARVLVLV